MDQIGEPTQEQKLEGFKFLLIITEILGIILVILTIVWVAFYKHGFAWTSAPQLEFNWHPVFMVFGFVFLYANAMLLYRVKRTLRKRRLKLMHAGFMFSILFFVIIALVAVFDSHNLNVDKDNKPSPIPNMYSLHSWVGMTSVILFCCQWVTGCISFLYPGLHLPLRASYMPIHVYFGIAGFIGVIASCLLGLNEKAIFSIPHYSSFESEGILVNMIGLVLIIFGGLSVYLVTQERYKRLPRPEDDVLLASRSN